MRPDTGIDVESQATTPPKLPNKLYRAELNRLQNELVEMQEWVKASGARIVVLFEGRDAAGKGARSSGSPTTSTRGSRRWWRCRRPPSDNAPSGTSSATSKHLPAAGEIRLFDRSWYNRAGVEKVMGYCTPTEHTRFLGQCPVFERMLIDDGIILLKYWFSVSDHEQERRFRSRLTDPMRRWKLSPTDVESLTRWEEYSRAKDEMFVHTDIAPARWFVVEAENKKRARLNMIHHLLSSVPYAHVEPPTLELPDRLPTTGYRRTDRALQLMVPDHSATLEPVKALPPYMDPEDE